MRPCLVPAALVALASPALAADLPAPARLPPLPPLVYARPAPPPLVAFECSRDTGQPITVIYNEPGRTPWSVVPDVALVPLPGATPYKTRAVYPRGY